MDLDIDNLFGDIEAQSVGGSDGENDTDQQHQHNYEEEEQRETNNVETTGETQAPESIKVKRVMNPQPKLDAQRLTGPRGMFALHKTFRNFKFKGKGHEREDLQILLKMLEHWAHRLYPKLPFKDTLEQIEKLGAKKNIQVNMRKFRLDMMGENGDEDDNVRRGPDNENSETTPVVDVFDELLGITSDQPTTTTTITNNDINTTIPPQTTVLPGSQSPKRSTMTPEQRERMERNRRLAIEKRLARMKEQQEKQLLEQEQEMLEFAGQETTASQVVDYFDNLQGTGRLLGTKEDTEGKLMETEAITDKLEDSEETPDIPEAFSEPQAPGDTLSSQDKIGHETEGVPFSQRLDEDTQASIQTLTTPKDNNGTVHETEQPLEPLPEMEVELHDKNDLNQVQGEDSLREEV